MSHLKLSHHVGGTTRSHNTFLVIFKVHSDSIHLWGNEEQTKKLAGSSSYSISCHNVETNSAHPSSDINVFILRSPEPPLGTIKIEEQCTFQPQQAIGNRINPNDLTIFMTGPVASTRKTSYAFDIIENDDVGISRKLGSAYIYLDPDFSSQGAQRTPIVASHTHMLIGQIQVEYLIVTNPVAYGLPAPRPEWLYKGLVFAGHRGAGSGRREDLPDNLLENTIASFNFAHKHGADFCELDVLVSADGVPVVYHDFDVDAVTAHQSSSELGKFRIQVNEFTVKQLRDFRLVSLQDENGHQFTLNVPNQIETNRPFPTLAEVLQEVDETCGLNIEIKWPQMLECGQMEARRYRELNDFVERIIEDVEKYAGNRRIVLESFEPDLCVMLRLKQNRFPVMFLSQGLSDKYPSYTDIRTRSVINGILFAHAFDIAGIDLIQEYYISSGKKLVDFIRDHNLVPRTWGELEEGLKSVQYLKELGIQCITCDKVDLLLNDDSKPS